MNRQLSFFTLTLAILLSSCGGKAEPEINPEGVANLSATGVNQGIALTWKADEGASSYVIYNGDKAVAETENTFFTLSFLNNNQSYKVGVAAKKEDKVSNVTYIFATPNEEKDYDPFLEDLNTGLEKRIGESKIKKMFTAGNINNDVTNIERYKLVLDKMANGISQTIAYIGGSITVGEKAIVVDKNNHQKGYAYHSYNWLKEHYDKNQNSKFINASISGTDSSIATVRLEKDVLVNKPNLVFLEFAGNNGTTEFDKKTYESLIRRILTQEQKPAVILLFSAANYVQSQVNYMQPMGSYYHLPMFSMLGAMNQVVSTYDKSDPVFKYFISSDPDDIVHPNAQGHILYAKTLCYTLKQLYKSQYSQSEYVTPSKPSQNRYDDYVDFTYVNNEYNNEIISSLGSFEAKETSHRVLKDTADVFAFQKGWKKLNGNANEPMQIHVTCRNFFIIYMAGNPAINGDPKGKMIASYVDSSDPNKKGSLSWESDRTCKQANISTVIDNGNGWDNPCAMILLDNEESATYDISIKMENASNLGTILAFGYSK